MGKYIYAVTAMILALVFKAQGSLTEQTFLGLLVIIIIVFRLVACLERKKCD